MDKETFLEEEKKLKSTVAKITEEEASIEDTLSKADMNYDMENGVVEIGYSLAKWKWNQGYMTEALEKVIEYTFETMDVNRIEAMHEPENPASGRVMEKCGFKKEGLLRQRLYNKGKYVDVCLYSLLRGEWKSKERRSIE